MAAASSVLLSRATVKERGAGKECRRLRFAEQARGMWPCVLENQPAFGINPIASISRAQSKGVRPAWMRVRVGRVSSLLK